MSQPIPISDAEIDAVLKAIREGRHKFSEICNVVPVSAQRSTQQHRNRVDRILRTLRVHGRITYVSPRTGWRLSEMPTRYKAQ
jgi:hypothetical protein